MCALCSCNFRKSPSLAFVFYFCKKHERVNKMRGGGAAVRVGLSANGEKINSVGGGKKENEKGKKKHQTIHPKFPFFSLLPSPHELISSTHGCRALEMYSCLKAKLVPASIWSQ